MLYKNKNDKIVIGISWTKNINNENKKSNIADKVNYMPCLLRIQNLYLLTHFYKFGQ